MLEVEAAAARSFVAFMGLQQKVIVRKAGVLDPGQPVSGIATLDCVLV